MTIVRVLRGALAGAAILASLVTARAADAVHVRYSWKLKGEYAPFYVAKEEGLFERRDLDVALGEGAGAPAALAGLLQGSEDVVVLPAAFALTAISKGMPIKIIALYNPKTPLGFLSFPDKPVRQPKDLEGKSLIVSVGDTVAAYLPAFCKINGVDIDKINKVSMSVDARDSQFLARRVEVLGSYLNVDGPLLESKVAEPLVVLNLADYGLALPGLSIVSSDAKIAQSPEKLAKFLAAVGQGVSDSRTDPAAATRALMKSWPGSPAAPVVQKQITETLAAIPELPGKPVGWTDPATLDQALALLKGTGEIAEPKPLDAYFTNALLKP